MATRLKQEIRWWRLNLKARVEARRTRGHDRHGEPVCVDCRTSLVVWEDRSGDRCLRCEVVNLKKHRARLAWTLAIGALLALMVWQGPENDGRPDDVPAGSCLANPGQPGC